jgi:hypothetical protein
MRYSTEGDANFGRPQFQVFRMRIDGAESRLIQLPMFTEDFAHAAAPTFDYNQQTVWAQINVPRRGGASVFDRFDLDGGQHRDVWHPIDDVNVSLQIPVSAPASSPDGRKLAFRFGEIGLASPVAVRDLRDKSTRILQTDAAGVEHALAPIVAGICRTMTNARAGNLHLESMTVPGRWSQGRPKYNPFADLLKRPAEIEKIPSERMLTINKLAHQGIIHLQECSKRGLPESASARQRWHEVAAVFRYVRGDWDAARGPSDEMLSLSRRACEDRYFGLVIWKAQCWEGAGQPAMARLLLERAAAQREWSLGLRRKPEPSLGESGNWIRNVPSTISDPYLTRIMDLLSTKSNIDDEP